MARSSSLFPIYLFYVAWSCQRDRSFNWLTKKISKNLNLKNLRIKLLVQNLLFLLKFCYFLPNSVSLQLECYFQVSLWVDFVHFTFCESAQIASLCFGKGTYTTISMLITILLGFISSTSAFGFVSAMCNVSMILTSILKSLCIFHLRVCLSWWKLNNKLPWKIF